MNIVIFPFNLRIFRAMIGENSELEINIDLDINLYRQKK